MDCEKFEAAILDELYGELDELTSASAKRHVAGCARCSARLGGLRATRRIAVIPQLEPSDDLEDRIFRAIERAQAQPAPRRLTEVVSLAGAWAMRPQTAMAAVFLVMIGTSVLLLRGTSARAPASSEVTVTERGTPAPAACAAPLPPGEAPAELEHQKTTAVASAGAEAKQPGWASAPPPPSPPSQAQSPAGGGAALATQPAARAAPDLVFAQPPTVLGNNGTDDLFDVALRSYRAGRFDEATREFDAIGPSDPNAPDLWAARSVRDSNKGCRAAVGRFDKTAQRYRQASPGWDALLEGALCYRALGDLATARARLNALLSVDSHKDRARAELDRIDELQQAQANRDTPAPAKPAAKARPPSAAAAPAIPTPPAAPPQSAGEATDSLR